VQLLEAFGAGTAAVISPIKAIHYHGKVRTRRRRRRRSVMGCFGHLITFFCCCGTGHCHHS